MVELKNKYYVYVYIDPRNNLPFYVCKGSRERAWDHLNKEKEHKDNRWKYNIIRKLKSLGLKPIIEFYKENIINEDDAYKLEAKLIKKYGRSGIDLGGILTNRILDNRPPSRKGCKLSKEHKRKISLRFSGKNHPLFGTHQSIKTKKQNMMNQPNRIPINIDGIKYPSIYEASRKTGLSRGQIYYRKYIGVI